MIIPLLKNIETNQTKARDITAAGGTVNKTTSSITVERLHYLKRVRTVSMEGPFHSL